jgi:hypothetical protein
MKAGYPVHTFRTLEKPVPIHSGTWAVNWMKPEPMHSVEILDALVANPDLRIEIKCLP